MRIHAFIASVILAFAAVGCSDAMLIELQTPGEAPPKVSAKFQAEITRLAAEGYRLKEAVEASLDGSNQHLAATFERAKPKDPSQAYDFRIIESDGRTAKTIFQRSEYFFSFDASGEEAKLNATDINGDGLKEVIVQSSSGGNCWSCNPVEIYRVSNHKGELIAAAPIQKIADLNGDRIAELVVTDGRWELYEDFSHAASPSAAIVYTWRDGRYVYASRDFPAFYKDEVDRLRASIEEAKAEITADEFSDEIYVGHAVSLAITLTHMGEMDRAIKELETLMSSNAKSPEQRKRRKTVLTDFQAGESAKKLREMKHGDPMPLG
ncbi:MAG TPA: VCBS repeat-containing protein [Blastocatellia bacterium]|nr:VCBS repeat-containing protein [Blastocatellia bacterium]